MSERKEPLPLPEFSYRAEFDLSSYMDEYTKRVQRAIDEQVLHNCERELEGFGYVKVVRCRDCKWFKDYENTFEPDLGYCSEHDREEVRGSWFCAWAERREA